MPSAPLLALPLAALLVPALAHAGPTIAVMPFKNLSQAKGAVGEAIRETVTTDLKGVPGIKVIERSFIDKVIAEQNLQSQKADLDPTSTVKVGKLLGAQLIVAGAYQESSGQVRLTSRFVSVESGQVVGSAKVDGKAGDFLSLQDRVTVELLKSAGIASPREHLGRKPRPRVRSLKTLELYGDALLASDDSRRRDLLKMAVAQDPDFVYAAQDLAALEERLLHYDRAAAGAQAREIKQLQEQLDAEKDPARQAALLQSLLNNLMVGRKYKQLGALCRWIIASNPPPAASGYPPFAEQAYNSLITVMMMYNDWDGILREGEKFIARYPQSMYFGGVRGQIDRAISEKHFMEDGIQRAKDELAHLSPEERANPCVTVVIYTRNKQWADARRTLETMKPGQCLLIQSEFQWMQIGMATGDFALARRMLEQMKGIGETVTSAITGTPNVTLVERNQVDQAIQEIDFGATRYVDPKTAAALGRMTGVSLAVQGGFQTAGGQIRVNARFVRVATGEILESLVITRPRSDLFAVQDAVAAELKTRLAARAQAK